MAGGAIGWIGTLLLVFPSALPAAPGAGGAASEAFPDGPRIVFETPEGRPDLVTVHVRGLPADRLRAIAPGPSLDGVLEVVAVDPSFAGDPAGLPALLGSVASETDPAGGAELVFRPRFPPSPGLELVARFDPRAWARARATDGEEDDAGEILEARFRVPELDRDPSTRVVAVHPAEDVLPANLLRLYVTFSAPMSGRQVLPHVRLLDPQGRDVDVAFVGVPGGLWDPDRRRLTLLVHPGRVKRGVGPHETLGPVLEEGERYRLVIDAEAQDADGLPLAEAHVHTFRVASPDYRGPDPGSWRLGLPSDARAALTVALEEPADRALLERLLAVEDPDGRRVSGDVEVSDGARGWTFLPREPWRAGRYTLVVPPELEDPSGNRPGRSFEEAETGGRGRDTVGSVRLGFEIGPF